MTGRRSLTAWVARHRHSNAAILVAAQGVNLAAVLLIARLYAPAAFGRYAALAAVAAVAAGASSLRLDVAATTADEADSIVLLRTARRLNLSVGLGTLLAAVAWHGLTAHLDTAALIEAIAIGATTATMGLSGTLVYARVRDRRYGLIAASKLVTAAVQAAGQMGLGLVGRTAASLLIATALGYAAAVLLLWRPAPSASPTHRVREVLARHRGFMLASAPAGLVNGLTMNVPLFVAVLATGSAGAADLALALRLGALPSALFGQALMPILYGEIAHRLRDAPDRALSTYNRSLLALSGGGAVLLTALSVGVYYAAPSLLGPQWAGVGVVLLLLSPFLMGQFAVAPLSQTLSATGGNTLQLMWDVGRMVAAIAAFVPHLMGWSDLRSAVVYFSVAMLGAYVAHVWLSRAALQRIRLAVSAVPPAGGEASHRPTALPVG